MFEVSHQIELLVQEISLALCLPLVYQNVLFNQLSKPQRYSMYNVMYIQAIIYIWICILLIIVC